MGWILHHFVYPSSLIHLKGGRPELKKEEEKDVLACVTACYMVSQPNSVGGLWHSTETSSLGKKESHCALVIDSGREGLEENEDRAHTCNP